MHQAAFEVEKIDATVEIINIKPDKIDELANFCYESDLNGMAGASISDPFQDIVMDFLDYYDPISKKIGLADTLKNEDFNLNAYNTRVTGIMQAIQEKITLPGKKVLILGAGRQAEMAAYGLKEFGADVYLWNRSKKKVDALASAMEINVINFRDIQGANFDLIINATPVGSGAFKGQSLLSPEQISENCVVVETILTPEVTQLLKNAKSAGAKTVAGDRILLHQSAGQFEIWFDKSAPIEAMEKALKNK